MPANPIMTSGLPAAASATSSSGTPGTPVAGRIAPSPGDFGARMHVYGDEIIDIHSNHST